MNIGLDFSNQEGKLLYIDSNGNIGFLRLGEGLTISNGVLGISLGYVGEDMVLLTRDGEFLIDNKDNYLTVTNYIQSVEEVMW